MFILENVPLSAYSTMRLGGNAAYLTEVHSRDEIVEALEFATSKQIPAMMVGIGSNIVWKDEGYPGLILVDKIKGFDVYEMDAENVYVTIGGGENWDEVVGRTVSMGLSGLEQLSLIPGTAGATPVQNVGAYGKEIADILITLEAYDWQTKQFVTMRGSDCDFSYRSSRFKTTDRGRFFINSVTLLARRINPQPPFYGSLEQYFNEHGIKEFMPQTVRDAVITIRSSKLPDPATVANNGSFFANPIISADKLHRLLDDYPTIPYWQKEPGKVKVAAAWLIDQAGFKGFHDPETGMSTWEKQALVFVNENAHSTADLLKFKQKIVGAVQTKFGITLEQEPELI